MERYISQSLGFASQAVANTLKLLADGATIPFISRYRKEATGGLDEVQIANVATKEEFRRCGVGSALMDALTKMSKKADAEVITLEVRSKNVPAISLYEKYGFVTVGVRKNFYKKPDDDAVLMNLQLQ